VRVEPAGPRIESAPPRIEAPAVRYEAPGNEDTGRRHRADGVPPSWTVRPAAAPNGVSGVTPVADPAGARRPSAPAGPPRFDDTNAYAGWLSGDGGRAEPPTRATDLAHGSATDWSVAPLPNGARSGWPGGASLDDRSAGPGRAGDRSGAGRPLTDWSAGPRRGDGPDQDSGPRWPAADLSGAWSATDLAGGGSGAGWSAADGGPAGWSAGIGAGAGTYRAPAAAGAVGLLERTPDRYGLLTHDPDQAGSPYEDDLPEYDDGIPGRHRRTAGPPRNRRPRWVRTLGWIGAFLAVLLVVGGGFALYQYKTLSGNIHRVDALAPTDGSIRNAAKQLDAENYLLIGSDTRSGANGAYEDTAGQVSGARSDTTILAHLSPNRDKAELISFPRDSWVSLPSCQKAGGGTEPAHDGQFNEAFSIGGPACTVLAVQKLTGIKINHYVQVDFTGFKTMVDALNGVSICSTTPLRDDESGLRLPAGTSVLEGEQALAYVRARYGIGDGSDLGRIQRQQRFLGAMVRSATSTKLLVNPVALTKFLGAATKSLTLDKQTSFGDLKQLADQLHGLDPKKVSFLTAPIANPAYTPPGFPQPPPGQGGSRVLLDDVAGRTLYDSIINDKPQPPATAGKPAASPKPNVLTVAPQEVSVRVLNGVGVGGLGRKVSGDLQSAGFTTVEPANAPGTATTTVRYGPDNKDEAQTLAAAVPGAVLQPDASTDLDLVVGSNYTTVKTVKIGDPATGKAAVAPKPKPAAATTAAVTAADARCG
jgi:LCP family protein required for cell wall assembly